MEKVPRKEGNEMERNFTCNVYVVDEPMGRGKTSAAINYINGNEGRYLVITPYLDEVKKYKRLCRGKSFVEPTYNNNGSKLSSIKELIKAGENIVSTHALFQKFDAELIEICKLMDYTLIMDEVADVVEQFDLSTYDEKNLLNNYVEVEDDTGLIHWKEDQSSYTGKFSDIKRLCDMDSLALYRENIAMWLFPVQVFNSFKDIFILTYMFNAQIQRYYYDFYKLPYSYIHVTGDALENYNFSDTPSPRNFEYGKLINLLGNSKLNEIGNKPFSLSKSWYEKADGTVLLEQVQNNVGNYFKHIVKGKSSENLWTVYKSFKSDLSGKGYTKGFLELNARATNVHRHRKNVAYMANVFLNPVIKQFFLSHGVDVDDDGYALSEMLQFIWRSAIRDGKPINVYVPSYRMRKLLSDWIKMENYIVEEGGKG